MVRLKNNDTIKKIGRLKNNLLSIDNINLTNNLKRGVDTMAKNLILKSKDVSLKGNKITVAGKTFTLSKEIITASKSKNYDNFRVLVLEFIQSLYSKFNVDSIKRKVHIRKILLATYNKSMVYRVDNVIKPKVAKKVKTTKVKITNVTKPKKAKVKKAKKVVAVS